jgi:hypothetical protein
LGRVLFNLTHLSTHLCAMCADVQRRFKNVSNVWADKLNRDAYMDDLQLKPRIFTYLDSLWGPHSIDGFAMQGNTQLPCYNS